MNIYNNANGNLAELKYLPPSGAETLQTGKPLASINDVLSPINNTYMFWGLTTAGLFYGVYLFRESIDFFKSKLSQV